MLYTLGNFLKHVINNEQANIGFKERKQIFPLEKKGGIEKHRDISLTV